MNHLIRLLLLVACVCQLSCSDDDEQVKEKAPITFELISEEIPSGTLTVEKFVLLDAQEVENNGKRYYVFEYSFEIHNGSSEVLELSDWSVQNVIYVGSVGYGAAGTSLPATNIAAGDKYLLSYSANSSQIDNTLAVNGLTLEIIVRHNDDEIIKMEYVIHAKE